MTAEKRWLCPECGAEFGNNFLRCACGYEGLPVFAETETLVTDGFPEEALTEEQAGFYLAEGYIRKAELEYQKLQEERIATGRLKKRLMNELRKLKQKEGRDPFETLCVHRTDSLETIHRTYRSIVAAYHPDKHCTATEESKKQKSNYLSRINGAYEQILQIHRMKDQKTKK